MTAASFTSPRPIPFRIGERNAEEEAARRGGGDQPLRHPGQVGGDRDAEAKDGADDQDFVRNQPLFKIGDGDRRQHRDEDQVDRDLRRVAPVDQHDGRPQESHGQLGERVEGRDPLATAARPATQEDPRDDRDVVAGGDRRAASGTPRARPDDRLPPRDPVSDDRDEAADDQPLHERDYGPGCHWRKFYPSVRRPGAAGLTVVPARAADHLEAKLGATRFPVSDRVDRLDPNNVAPFCAAA